MITDVFLVVVGIAGLLVASITDIKTREVPDWLSYSLIASGIGLRLIYSAATYDWLYFVYGLLGFGIMFGIGNLMYYGKQWGGGDTKIMMGLGALFATSPTGQGYFLFSLWLNILIIGAMYGIAWSAVLAARHRDRFANEAKRLFSQKIVSRRVYLGVSLLFLAGFFFIDDPLPKFMAAMFGLFILIYEYLLILIRAVENVCLYKLVPVAKLTEGDWIAKEVYVGRKLVTGPKSLGIEKNEINILRKAGIGKVLVKEGIPFIPPFFLGLIFTLIYGNPFL
jgi:Flp pilus assembly protein protease CpaA